MKTTEQILIDKYGPLLTFIQVAELLDRSVQGLRMTLGGNSEFAKTMRPARRKIGRRVYFKVADLAKLIDGEVQ